MRIAYGCALGMALIVAGCLPADERLERRVEERLEAKGHGEIDVSVYRGVVTLRGEVKSKDEWRMVEATANATEGVRWVDNELVVPLPPILKAPEPP